MPRVFVAGSINMDVVAKAERHPAPGETVLGSTLQMIPGGKGANQALASARLGMETLLVGCVGADLFGSELCAFLAQSKLNLKHIKRVEKTATGTALIVVNQHGENTIVVVPGANTSLAPADVLSIDCSSNDILVAQFEIPLPTITAFFQHGKSRGAVNVLNPAPAQRVPSALLALTDVIVINETELQLLTGEQVSLKNAADCCRKLQAFPQQVVVLTLGKEGVVAITESGIFRVPGHSVNAVDTTGAGDCFVGALASRLSLGLPMERSITFANKAAALSVQQFGAATSMPTLREVDLF